MFGCGPVYQICVGELTYETSQDSLMLLIGGTYPEMRLQADYAVDIGKPVRRT